MSIKINQKQKETTVDYPIAKEHISNGAVWIFTDKHAGFCVVAGGPYKVGEHSKGLFCHDNDRIWKDVSITIENP